LIKRFIVLNVMFCVSYDDDVLLMSREVKRSHCVRLTPNCVISSKLRKPSLQLTYCAPASVLAATLRPIIGLSCYWKNISWFSVLNIS